MFQRTENENPLALVTSASYGIGYEISKRLAKLGYDLILVADNPAIVEAAQVCESNGVHVEKCFIDLSQIEGVSKLYDKILSMKKSLDVIVFNSDHDRIDVINLLNLNIISPIYLIKLLKSDLKKNENTKILFTSFMHQDISQDFLAAVEGSQSFLKTYTELIGKELKKEGIQVTSLITKEKLNRKHLLSEEIAKQCSEALFSGLETVNLDHFNIKDLHKIKS